MNKKKIFFIAINILIWAVYLFLPDLTSDDDFKWEQFIFRNKEMLLLLSYFYLNFFLIIPKSLDNKKITWFIISTIGCFTIYLLIQPAIDIAVFKNFGNEAEGGFRRYRDRVLERGYHISTRGAFRNIAQITFFFAVSTGWKVYQRLRNEEKQKDQAQKEKLTAELSLLKSQVSPHFLFNSLNSIYSLTVQQSENAPTAVVKLSELLRYMIYQANKDRVQLSEELNYIENFIELQKLRLAKDVTIRYEVNIPSRALEIEPMLLIPIIENTFKHGVSYKEPTEIIIRIEYIENKLVLHTENQVFTKKKEESSGFGLENLQKRLNLQYPGSYGLEINETGSRFVVDFSIKLEA